MPCRYSGVAGQPLGHVLAVGQLRGTLDVEGAEHGGRRRRRVEPVVHLDDEHRQAEDVGGEDELLALLGADLPGRRQPLHRGHPLGLGQPDLAGEVVQVAHQRGHDLGQARVFAVAQRSTARSVMLSSVTSCTGTSCDGTRPAGAGRGEVRA